MRLGRLAFGFVSAAAVTFLVACSHAAANRVVATLPILPTTPAAKIVDGAHLQAAHGALYDPGYAVLDYPGGDVPAERGACTDVVIRAFRHAGFDLQRLIHEDAEAHRYPKIGSKLDSNIDHRRCPNQVEYFKRHGITLTTSTNKESLASWKPGDVVYWKLLGGADHTGVVSDHVGQSGLPMVIHNLEKCREEDVLASWKIVGHYRFPTK